MDAEDVLGHAGTETQARSNEGSTPVTITDMKYNCCQKSKLVVNFDVRSSCCCLDKHTMVTISMMCCQARRQGLFEEWTGVQADKNELREALMEFRNLWSQPALGSYRRPFQLPPAILARTSSCQAVREA